jgi:predicted dehydrogenase
MSEEMKATRREVLVGTAALGAAAMMSSLGTNYAHAQGNGRIRVGVIGCGGRGSGAIGDNLKASKEMQVTALGDAFAGRMEGTRKSLRDNADFKDQVAIDDKNCFVGLDSYKKVIDSGVVDLVILATPPGFRPLHLDYAVKAGKHVFMEKPVAVDVVGCKSVMASGEIAAQKKLAIVTGTQRRHQRRYVETMQQLHEGKVGDVLGGHIYWNQGGLWHVPREAGWSDVEWQLRNWLYFTWLSGDHIVEQHVHNIDVMNWAMNAHPTKAYGMGGRQWRTDPAYGHIYDHFAIEYEFPGGARWAGQCRQIDGTASRVGEDFILSNGSAWIGGLRGRDGKSIWRFEGDERNPYEQEHVDMVASIKEGKPLNEAKRIAESTLTAIMAREAAYTGQEVTWDALLASDQNLSPMPLDSLGIKMSLPVPAVPMPGKTKLVRNDFDRAYIASMSPAPRKADDPFKTPLSELVNSAKQNAKG